MTFFVVEELFNLDMIIKRVVHWIIWGNINSGE